MWLRKIDVGAMEQLYNLSRLPFVFKHIAAMSDCHLGYGMPIGGVMATHSDYVIPNAVGVDIGCGVLCIRTDLTSTPGKVILNKIKADIRKLIPMGYKHQKEPQMGLIQRPPTPQYVGGPICRREYTSATRQLGTLGGGNHFIEIQLGDDGYIYIMIHSGSRNIGKQIADHYNKIAIELNEMWFSQVPKKWELAFLPTSSEHGRAYINEMIYAVRFADANRMLMLERVKEAFINHIPTTFYDHDVVHIAHNFARIENHFGKNVMVHRKGSTPAYKGQLGLIPGSQGSNSYIVEGKGNPESFMSCAHGAGRALGRRKAKENLVLKDEIKILDDQGIIHGIRKIKDLEEATGAYKDINEVMNLQKNLVKIIRKLQPLAVIKG
jgi:tRNA-splicing ligase RtcB